MKNLTTFKVNLLLKLFLILLIVACLASCFILPSFALSDPYYINGDTCEPSDNAIDLEHFANNDFKIQPSIRQKINYILNRNTINYTGSIVVQVCTQENSYYCGPATVQQTIKYINGVADSQSDIANDIGTTSDGSVLSYMVDYINDRITGHYIIVSNPSKQRIQEMVEYGVTHSMPVICRLRFTAGSVWPYSTNGHYMNANAYTNYGAEICVTDPNIKRVNPSAGGNYWVSIDALYDATHTHPAQEMAY